MERVCPVITSQSLRIPPIRASLHKLFEEYLSGIRKARPRFSLKKNRRFFFKKSTGRPSKKLIQALIRSRIKSWIAFSRVFICLSEWPPKERRRFCFGQKTTGAGKIPPLPHPPEEKTLTFFRSSSKRKTTFLFWKFWKKRPPGRKMGVPKTPPNFGQGASICLKRDLLFWISSKRRSTFLFWKFWKKSPLTTGAFCAKAQNVPQPGGDFFPWKFSLGHTRFARMRPKLHYVPLWNFMFVKWALLTIELRSIQALPAVEYLMNQVFVTSIIAWYLLVSVCVASSEALQTSIPQDAVMAKNAKKHGSWGYPRKPLFCHFYAWNSRGEKRPFFDKSRFGQIFKSSFLQSFQESSQD